MEGGMVTPAPVLVRSTGIQKTYDGEHLVVKNSTSKSGRASSSPCSALRARARRPRLMMLAGFEVPTHGEIYLADRPIKNMPPQSATSAWSSRTTPCFRT